jgi:hypothetical protein
MIRSYRDRYLKGGEYEKMNSLLQEVLRMLNVLISKLKSNA